MHYDAVIIGAGPAGLSCALELAKNNIKTLVVERNFEVGPKVCAGGITWSGLVQHIPQHLIEKKFNKQRIVTRLQNFQIQEKNPVIATVDRAILGKHMAEQCRKLGVDILSSTVASTIDRNCVYLTDKKKGKSFACRFDFLIGADGAASIVRRYLKLPVTTYGVGIDYRITGNVREMEWHLNQQYFSNGYGWIFPHKNTVSLGAYAIKDMISASTLHNNIVRWGSTMGYSLENCRCRAGRISFDYRGWKFDRIFLAGDAAGLASPLTGEGIYPAIVSGEIVAKTIAGQQTDPSAMSDLVARQRIFRRLTSLTSKNTYLSNIFAELGALAMRFRILDFTKLEMALK